ncbi:MAG: AI-2E family transporter [Acidobacteriota bacterium]
MSNVAVERERFVLVLFYGMVLLVGYLAFQVVSPFLIPLTWSAIFAMILSPVSRRLAPRIGQSWAAIVTTLATFLGIVVPAIVVGTLLVHEVSGRIQTASASGVVAASPARVQQAWELLREQAPYLHLPANPTTNIQDAIQSAASFAATRAASILTDVATSVLQLFLMLFGLFYFLRDGTSIVEVIRQLLPFEPERRDRIINQSYELVVATVGAMFAVAVSQGTITGIALGALGFSAPVFWGVMTAFASLIPLVGAGLIWAPAALWLFATGDPVRGAILLVVGIAVISTVDQVIRPWILSGRTTMHGLLVFISLLGGVSAFGFIGLVVGPVVIAAGATLLESVLEGKPTETTVA